MKEGHGAARLFRARIVYPRCTGLPRTALVHVRTDLFLLLLLLRRSLARRRQLPPLLRLELKRHDKVRLCLPALLPLREPPLARKDDGLAVPVLVELEAEPTGEGEAERVKVEEPVREVAPDEVRRREGDGAPRVLLGEEGAARGWVRGRGGGRGGRQQRRDVLGESVGLERREGLGRRVLLGGEVLQRRKEWRLRRYSTSVWLWTE